MTTNTPVVNTAFVRQYFDLTPDVAAQLNTAAKASGKSKKQFLTDIVTAAVKSSKGKSK